MQIIHIVDEDGIREKRNKLLKDSDWSQLPDAPVDKNTWKNYRHKLRTLTNQPGYPYEIDWPKLPDT